MDYKAKIKEQREELEKRLNLLNESEIDKLLSDRNDYLGKIAEIDAKIEQIQKETGVQILPTPESHGEKAPKSVAKKATESGSTGRENMKPDVIKSKILETLKNNPDGLNQTDLAKKSGVNYSSVKSFINKNSELIETSGERMKKIYKLKPE